VRFTHAGAEYNDYSFVGGDSMGLDAFVNCNCYKEGKTTEPPVDRKYIYFDDGFYHFKLPGGNDREIFRQFIDWMDTACDHRRFHYIWTRISNISGLHFFMKMISKYSESSFPALRRAFSDRHATPPEDSLVALDEVKDIEERIQCVRANFLMDKMSGEELRHSVDGDDFLFYMHGPEYQYGLGDAGFFITESFGEDTCFASRYFSQSVTDEDGNRILEMDIEKNKPRKPTDVRFRDFATGGEYTCRIPLEIMEVRGIEENFWPHETYPAELEVIKRNMTKEDIEYIVKPLRSVLEASVLLGNPVYWA
jgi:hypothetical protein